MVSLSSIGRLLWMGTLLFGFERVSLPVRSRPMEVSLMRPTQRMRPMPVTRQTPPTLPMQRIRPMPVTRQTPPTLPMHLRPPTLPTHPIPAMCPTQPMRPIRLMLPMRAIQVRPTQSAAMVSKRLVKSAMTTTPTPKPVPTAKAARSAPSNARGSMVRRAFVATVQSMKTMVNPVMTKIPTTPMAF